MGRETVSGSIRATAARAALARKHAVEPDRVRRFEARMARLADVRRRVNSEKRWCILRTSSLSTVALLDDLESAGFDVWTPTQVIEAKMGRARDTVERCTAMLPSFVFAAESDAADLLRLSLNPAKSSVDFTVFLHRDRVPFIKDSALAPMRQMEEDAVIARHELRASRALQTIRRLLVEEAKTERERLAKMRNSACPVPVGAAVTLSSGAWAGKSGVVVKSVRGVTTINMGGAFDVKIDTFLLASDLLERASA